jgi:hypothetical protein
MFQQKISTQCQESVLLFLRFWEPSFRRRSFKHRVIGITFSDWFENRWHKILPCGFDTSERRKSAAEALVRIVWGAQIAQNRMTNPADGCAV